MDAAGHVQITRRCPTHCLKHDRLRAYLSGLGDPPALALALVLGGFTAWRFLPRPRLNVALFALYVLVLLGMGWCLLLPGLQERRHAVAQAALPRRARYLAQHDADALPKDVPSRWATAQEALEAALAARRSAANARSRFIPSPRRSAKISPPSRVAGLQPDGTATRLRDTLKKSPTAPPA